MTRKVAIVGAGTAGREWAARFLLMGWDVSVFDPDPESVTHLGAVLERARLALSSLFDACLPDEGRLVVAQTLPEAVSGAQWVQESVPEQIDLKRDVIAAVEAHAPAEAVIASSSTGYRVTDLQDRAVRPGQVVAARAALPVYLLPHVELEGGEATRAETLASAREILEGLGMAPRTVAQGPLCGRLIDALVREAAAIRDEGLGSAAEIDRALATGPGLLLARQGVFETLRLAAGAGPEAAGEGATARDLDLVAMLRGLRRGNHAAGRHLNALDAGLTRAAGVARRFEDIADIHRPILTANRTVPTDWTDYNGHMNEAKYLQAFGDATDRFMEMVGCDAAYIATGGSFFTVETHIRHLMEVRAGCPIRIETLCLDGGGKRMHLFHEMRSGETLLATGEHLLLHVSLETRRACAPAAQIADAMGAIAAAHAALPQPEGIGRYVGAPR